VQSSGCVTKASGSERYAHTLFHPKAERLKPYALDVTDSVQSREWFLDGNGQRRSSYYLEDVATEFHVQGLELDWACVSWDGRHSVIKHLHGWQHFSFRRTSGSMSINLSEEQYLKNAYRVLLTRARQGMVLFVP